MCQCACWLVFTSIIGVVFYLLDVVTDLANGVIYIQRGDKYWGTATLVFIFLPVFVYIFLLFVYMLLEHCSDESSEPKQWSTTERLFKVPYWRSSLGWLQPQSSSCCKRLFVYVLVLCRLEPVSSYIECIRHGLRGTQGDFYEIQRSFFKKKQVQIFIETCMESLPQIALQLYILGRKSTISGFQIISLVSSIISAWFIFMYIQVEKKQKVTKKKVWAIKMLWCIFGGIPTLLGSFPAISFFAAVYDPPFLLLFIVIIVSFTVKWLFITTLRKYNKLSIRTMLCIIISLIKIGLLLMITLWYITVKNFNEKYMLSNLEVEDPATFIPHFIWPSPHKQLQKWAIKRGDITPPPAWAECDRMNMFRNGTFVVDSKRWLSEGTVTDNAYSFLKEDKLFCIADIADFVFCAVFYCIILWIIWDIFFYVIRCCVPSDENVDNPADTEMNELHTLM